MKSLTQTDRSYIVDERDIFLGLLLVFDSCMWVNRKASGKYMLDTNNCNIEPHGIRGH